MSGRSLLVLLVVAALTLAAALAAGGCGDGGGDDEATQVMARLLEFGQEAGADVEVLLGRSPEDFPQGIPQYPDSHLLGSTITTDEQQKNYTVVYESGDSLDEVLQYFEEALEKEPWQVVLSTSLKDFGALQFSRTDEPNFLGGVVVQASDEDASTAILVSAQTAQPGAVEPQPFELPASKPLPRGFPSQLPVMPDVTITDTAWARSAGAIDFQVNFLTQKSQQDILDYYRTELTSRGWNVTDETPQQGVAGLKFENTALGQTWTGTVSVVAFADDPTYAQASLQLRIGAQAEGTPTAVPPALTPTP